MFQYSKIVSYIPTGSMAVTIYIVPSDDGIKWLKSAEIVEWKYIL